MGFVLGDADEKILCLFKHYCSRFVWSLKIVNPRGPKDKNEIYMCLRSPSIFYLGFFIRTRS